MYDNAVSFSSCALREIALTLDGLTARGESNNIQQDSLRKEIDFFSKRLFLISDLFLQTSFLVDPCVAGLYL